MSYLAQGVGGILVGILLIPFLGIGLILIILSIYMLAVGSSTETPGQHRDRCSWLGHDWRKDMSAVYPGTRCRNCLRIKGQPAVVGYVPVAVPGYAPGYAAPAAYTPVYGVSEAAVNYGPALAAPTATQRAAYAPPIQQLVCPACKSPVQAGMTFCPWCRRPFG